ncbi:GNAT family N-acetyltransferase [Labilibaculum sp. A4]|uniref:GNAT family N-acetyltransferase n=1 Tax=Labilibaculum euxinus TaxID=2686357 RepID=UPI000F61F7A1|nr:GNAT family N-acetyltransferase [Labilibaculum euxinus]MDQ1769217.1 GNAT family N-acetyltransferase [Labilibaculum euxinus]MWN74741.1 GNAT family N-acetyltransferase [Labilibaculum euxinus]
MYHFRFITLNDLKEIDYFGNFPSNQFNWIYNWFSVFEKVENNVLGYNKKAFIVAAYKDDQLAAVVPLVKLYRIYFKVVKIEFLEFMGQQWSSLGNDILKFDDLEECFSSELISWIKTNIKFHFIFFKYLPESSVLANKYRLLHYAGAPFVRVDKYSSYEEFSDAVYARKFREDLRRTLRKIKKESFEIEVGFEEINEAGLTEIRRIAKTKERDGKSFLYGDAEKEQFHLKMYEIFPSQVVFVKFNQQVVAYATSIDWNGVRIGIDAAFDRDYRRYGVGIHCVDSIIQNSFKDGKQKISFGMGLDSYKFQFTDQVDRYFMCYDYKFRLKSLLALPYFLYCLKKEEQQVIKNLQNINGNGRI